MAEIYVISKMKRFFAIYIIMCLAALMWSCADEEYTVSQSDKLSFSTDTVRLDTVFSNVPSPTQSFWAFNGHKKGIRLTSVRLERGNQSGFRVNVDGVYLGSNTGYQTNEVEVRGGDSIRIFVELTSTTQNDLQPKELEDNLLFEHESGLVQKVNLNAFSWDATILRNAVIDKNTTFTGERPIVVYGPLTVNEGATLTLAPGTTLYLHDAANIDVYGKLIAQGQPGNEVVLRGYRLDHMFDYLPYDRVTGQWGGVHFHEKSYGNKLTYTDIHSTFDGVVVDSSNVEQRTLLMEQVTVHNCQGYGVANHNSWVELHNCQITNTLKDCLYTDGGTTIVNACTIAQFYPFDSARGVALRFTAEKGPVQIGCYNTLVTGYADDEIMGEQVTEGNSFYYEFEDCILRTPAVENDDTVHFVRVLFENPEDTVATGKKHFMLVDTDNLKYDFRLDSVSTAIDKANPLTSRPVDRHGVSRGDKPDIGAYEFKKEN